jgi:Rps23 Pro-64 3,4-dihydroxylase Tpa1-like proline 4-hydroxylase
MSTKATASWRWPLVEFALHPALDLDAARATFARDRRVQLAPFLSDASAAALAEDLAVREDWTLVLNAGDKTFEIDRAGQAALSEAQRAGLDARINAAARDGFQFRFESIRVPDDDDARAALDTPLAAFTRFLSSESVRTALRHVTDVRAIDFADAQATRYQAGDFLTGHDDDVAGKHRHAAYVLGLSPRWRTEWGGLLLFHDGSTVEGWAPQFNALSLFAVPQPHSVSIVTPFAGAPRVSVTGWLRSRA